MRHGAALAASFLALLGTPAPAARPPVNLAAVLSRGINFDHLFEPYRDPQEGWGEAEDREVAGRVREAEFAQVAALGFTHVRLNLGRCVLQEYAPPCPLREPGLTLLDRALDLAAKHKLAVVLDMHQIPVPPLDKDPDQRRGFRTLWRTLAARYKARPQPLVFELLNEPRVEDPGTWRGIVTELIADIRAVDPDRAVIVTGGGWGGAEDLRKLGNLRLPHLAYSFHFYDPFVFTHQGATWTDKVMTRLKGIRYPLDPAQLKAERDRMKAEGLETWPLDDGLDGDGGKEGLRKRMEAVMQFARDEKVLLYCGEFGVHKPYAPPADRARWTADVRGLLAAAGVPWSMWAYHAGFDLVEEDGRPTPAVVAALDLKRR